MEAWPDRNARTGCDCRRHAADAATSVAELREDQCPCLEGQEGQLMTMSRWVVTGVSGSERIEFLNEIAEGVRRRSKTVEVYDVGQLISEECERLRIVTVDSRMLDMDPHLLRAIRRSALKEVRISIAENPQVDLRLIGIHATFRWNGRLIAGVSWDDICEIGPDGFLNVVDNVDEVVERNRANPKWGRAEAPGPLRTQEWMMEEEFATQVFADVAGKPMYVVARKHAPDSMSELLLGSDKKRVYLSYPITAIKTESPDLLKRIQGPILSQLEELFVVFNPLSIQDVDSLSRRPRRLAIPGGRTHRRKHGPASQDVVVWAEETASVGDFADSDTCDPTVADEADSDHDLPAALIKARTIERDFRFVEQCDAVIAVYLTEKVSPGVLAKVMRAHRLQKPVFMVYPFRKSPFLEDVVTHFEDDLESMMVYLRQIANDDYYWR